MLSREIGAKLTSITKLKNNFTISQDKTQNYVSAIMESYLVRQKVERVRA